MQHSTVFDTPVGSVRATMTDEALTQLCFVSASPDAGRASHPLLADVAVQIDAYFAGTRIEFTVPTVLEGTPFQQRVWQALTAIPYGTTCAYRDIAQSIGKPSGVRAVASAIGRNPLAIIVPCHRVVGADGSLTGYAGGLERKAALLAHERHEIAALVRT